MKKDIFDLKKGNHQLYDRPQKFYEVHSSGAYVGLKIHTCYGVWHRSKIKGGKRFYVFYFQRKDSKGTRTFNWWLPVTDVAITVKDALEIAKAKRIERAKWRLEALKNSIEINKAYLKNYSNFEPIIDKTQLGSYLTDIDFPKLTEIRIELKKEQ